MLLCLLVELFLNDWRRKQVSDMDLAPVLILLDLRLGRLLLESVHFFVDPCILIHQLLLGGWEVVASNLFTFLPVNCEKFFEGILPLDRRDATNGCLCWALYRWF